MSDKKNIQDENEEAEVIPTSTCENCHRHEAGSRCGGDDKCKAEEYKSGWQRALADYKNLQKESADMRSVWAKASEQYILDEFIPVYENFKKAFSHRENLNEENGWKQWAEGIGHIKKQFGDILKTYQVEEIKTVGEKFDPRFHEAVGEEDGEESGMILKEIEGGYKRGDKIIKPARVIICK